MKDRLQKIKETALLQIENSDGLAKLNDVRVAFLGKKGELTAVLKGMKDVSPEDRPKVGQWVNETRDAIEQTLEAAKKRLEQKELEAKLSKEVIDVTLPSKRNKLGHRHPNASIQDEVERIFTGMGYEVVVVNQTGCQHPLAGVGFDVYGSLHDQMLFQIASRKDGGILHHIPVVVPAAADFIRICEGKAKFIKDGNNGLLQLLPLPLRGVCF